MKTHTPRGRWAGGLAAGAALAACLAAGPAKALDVLDPTGFIYSNVSDSSHYNESYAAVNLFTWDLSSVAVGSAIGGSEYARSGGGDSFVAFEVDKVYTGIGSIFYAQRGGGNPAADKISKISLWASSTAPYSAADPGTAPDSVISITNTTGGLWLEYLMTNTVSGRYFLLKLEQSSPNGNPGGHELRLGATLGLAPSIFAVNPAYTNTYTGNPVQFTAQVAGTAPLTFRWQAGPSGTGAFTNLVDSGDISGAASATLTLRNVPAGMADYQLIVTNPYGAATSAPPVTLMASGSLPQIVTPITPASLQQPAGYGFSLSVGVEGSWPLTYQWKRNGLALADDTRLSGTHSNVLTIANAQAVDAGAYQLFVHNADGDAVSTEATVTIVPSLPVIGPSGAIYTNVRDSSHYDANYVAANLFEKDVTGLPPGSMLDGRDFARSGPGSGFSWVAFEVDAVYSVGSIYFAQRPSGGDNIQKLSVWTRDAQAFDVADPGTPPDAVISLVSNSGTRVWREYFLPNNITGRYFLLKLEQTFITGNPGGNELRLGLAQQTPAIITGPTNQVAFSGNTVQFFVGASGAPPLAYHWQGRPAGSAAAFTNLVDSSTISGATTAALTLRNVPLVNMEYRLQISNGAGSVTSDAATLQVSTSGPQIVTGANPLTIHQPAGYALSIPVSVSGSLPITYQWQHNGQPLSDGGRISGARSNVLTIASAQAADAGTYRLSMNNAFGNALSPEVTVIIEPALGLYDGSAWTLNGGATVDGNGVLTLTDGGADQARSAFFNAPVPVDAFTATFTYQDVSVGGADGAAFVLHNAPAGPAALGPHGGYLGYMGITPSAALTFNIYNNPGIALKTGGIVGGYSGTGPVNIASGAPIAVMVQYAAGTMVVTLTDTWTLQSFTNTYSIDLAAAVGGHTAYVGFSGGDGTFTSTQQISGFSFVPLAAGPPQVVADVRPGRLTQPAGLGFSLSAGIGGTAPLTYQWKRDGVNLVDDGRISGARSNFLHIVSALPGDTGNYQLFVTNFYGWTNTSLAAVSVTNSIGLDDGTAWTLNGGATISSGVLTLTDGGGSEARSSFLSAPVPIEAFLASFTYKNPTAGGADGATFILHNDPAGAAALGGGGSGLGYSGISPSAAVEFNIYSDSPGGRGIALGVNGLTPQNGGEPYISTAPVNLASGHAIDVLLRYTGGVFSLTLTDAVDSVSFSTELNIDLPALAGGRTAYVGFSGATGGITSQQEITNFKFVPVPQVALQMSSPNTVVIAWPVTAAGFVLQQSSAVSGASWQNVTAPVNVVNGRNQVVVGAPSGNRFYRLVLP